MSNRAEIQMYPSVAKWLQKYLESVFNRAKIMVFDTHTTALNEVISRRGLQQYFASEIWQTFDIKIDITGFILRKKRLDLAFVECKAVPISLAHFSQLSGYCRIVNPLMAYLISPKGTGSTVNSLLLTYNRSDILEYHWEKGRQPRRIFIAKWNESTQSIDFGTVLPTGALSNLSLDC